MNFKNLAMWAIIVILTIGLYNMFKNPQGSVNQKNNIIFSEFLTQVDNGRVVQVEIQGKNSFDILNKLTHFDFREKSFKKSTAAQTLLARVDCSIFNLDLKLLLSCNRSFADYLKDRLIDAVNY